MLKVISIILSCFLIMGFGERTQQEVKGAPTDFANEFSLASVTESVFTLPLKGKGMAGTLTNTIGVQELLGGVAVIPHVTRIVVTGARNIDISSTSYHNLLGLLVSKKLTSGNICTPVTPDKTPILVSLNEKRPNNNGVRSVLHCTDGIGLAEDVTVHDTWKVTPAAGNKINYIINSTVKDTAGKDKSKTIVTYVINSGGVITNFTITANYYDTGKNSYINLGAQQ